MLAFLLGGQSDVCLFNVMAVYLFPVCCRDGLMINVGLFLISLPVSFNLMQKLSHGAGATPTPTAV